MSNKTKSWEIKKITQKYQKKKKKAQNLDDKVKIHLEDVQRGFFFLKKYLSKYYIISCFLRVGSWYDYLSG